MAKTRVILGLVAGCLLLWGGSAPAWAAPPSVKQMLQFKPRQKGVPYSVPADDELNACEVKLVTGSRPGASGWVLLDAKKQPVCRFFDSNGDKRIDIWSYYKDGLEVYREIDTNSNRPKGEETRPTQYRWLNGGGMKWGLDPNEDGRIDAWKKISSEELAQEVFQAAADRDLSRLSALFISEAEIRALRLPAARADQIRNLRKQAAKKFQATLDKLPALNDKAQFVRAESGPPHCIPADTAGTEDDLIQYPSRAILFKGSDGKFDWLQTGEMVEVGVAWRLLDAPSYQEPTGGSGGAVPKEEQDKALQGFYDQVNVLDKTAPAPTPDAGPNAELAKYNLQRVALIEQILPRLKEAKDRENWLKQLFDNLSTAAQYSDAKDKRAISRLAQVVKDAEGSSLAAYGTYRLLWAEYSPKIGNDAKIQEEWLDKLSKFVQTYPKAEDTADALFHLGMGCEFAGRDEQAKRWYQQLFSNFPDHALAVKAQGCKRRLELIGKELELTSPLLSDGSSFDVARLKGKVVAVYYWASYCSTCVSDFARLKQLHASYAAKGFELVMVNLDDRRDEATRYVSSNPVPGMHLFQAAKDGGGMNSPLALQYGIQGLPTLFLVGRDGKVVNRTLQIADLKDAIEKAL